MAFEVKKGSFPAKTSTGTQAITGVGFQPKAVILFWERQATTGFNAGNVSGGMGMFTAATDCAVTAWGINDNAAANAATGSFGYYNKGTYCCLMMSNATPTYARYASPVSLDADGFTLTWAAADASASIVHYIALGGSTLSNAKVAEATFKTSTGNKAVTGVGFQPDCLLFMGRRDGGTAFADVSIGAAISSSQRAQTSFGVLRGTTPSVVYQSQTTDRCLQIPDADAVSDSIDLVSMDADGFTFNQTAAFGVAAPFAYLALKGGSYKIGTETQKTSTGTKATTGVGFVPAGLLLFGANHTASASGVTDRRRISIGAASAPGTEGAVWDQAIDNVSTTQTAAASVTDKILRHATADSTTDAEADLASYDSDGFTLDWTTADATARQFIYLAFGPGTVTSTGYSDPVSLTVAHDLSITEDFDTATAYSDPVTLTVREALGWWPHAQEAAVGLGATGKWDDLLVYLPRVCKNLDGTPYQDGSSRYYVYYTAAGSTAGADRDRVGLLRTTDFVTWERVSTDNPVLGWGPAGVYDASGSVWDGTDVAATTVLHDGTQFIMFFEGNSTSNEAGDTVQLGVATSTDGIAWTKDSGNPILTRGTGSDKDTGDLYAPAVIKDGSTWKMWYVGHVNSSTYGIMYATAPAYNGPWTKHSPTTAYVFKPAANIGPSQVWKDTGGVYWMVYDNYDDVQTVRLAMSNDGITWGDQGEVFAVAPSGWDAGGVYWTDHFWDGSEWRMVYTGRNVGDTVYGIGTVTWPDPEIRLIDSFAIDLSDAVSVTVGHALTVSDSAGAVVPTPASPRISDAITASHTVAVLVEVLEDGEVVDEFDTVIDGTVTLDQTAASRGRCDIALVDDGSLGLVPNDAGDLLAPYGNELRISRGVIHTDDTTEYVRLGVFRIETATVDDTPGSLLIRIAGLDRSARIIDARFEEPYQVVDGTNYTTAIEDVIAAAYPDVVTDLTATTRTAPQLIAQEGDDRWAFAQDMARAIGMTLYFDGDGTLVLRPVSAAGQTPVAVLAEGEDGLLVQASRAWTRQGAFNRVIATGENTGLAAPARGVATDDNPLSPTYYYGDFGKVPRFYASPFITTDEQAADAAQAILARELGTTESVDFGTIVNPALKPDDVVSILRERAGIDEDHIIDSVTIPLTVEGGMTGKTRATQVNAGTVGS